MTEKELRPGERVEITGNHKYAGKKGRYMGLQSTRGIVKPAVKLDNGIEVFISDKETEWKREETKK